MDKIWLENNSDRISDQLFGHKKKQWVASGGEAHLLWPKFSDQSRSEFEIFDQFRSEIRSKSYELLQKRNLKTQCSL